MLAILKVCWCNVTEVNEEALFRCYLLDYEALSRYDLVAYEVLKHERRYI